MQSIYLNNFRGFTDTYFPIARINFLVGENSTGKTSVLRLIKALSSPHSFFNPAQMFDDKTETLGFSDIASTEGGEDAFFQVGLLSPQGADEKDQAASFRIYKFGPRDGALHLRRYASLSKGTAIMLDFGKSPRYKVERLSGSFSASEITKIFIRYASEQASAKCSGMSRLQKEAFGYPLPILESLVRREKVGQPEEDFQIEVGDSRLPSLAWIAPIRSKPQRTYDGVGPAYSPEGEHTPYLLRRQLKSKSKPTKLIEKIGDFGRSSGLFDSCSIHSFGDDGGSPFEVLIGLTGGALNITNVGYGVSQSLPFVVDLLSSSSAARLFSIQQPEVHLHPRAQAAVGDLLFQIAATTSHSFLIETHSDFLIDRFRLSMRRYKATPPETQVLFFSRSANGNSVQPIPVGRNGEYPVTEIEKFREFFIREEMSLLEL